jgi:hypothetical protein
LQGTLRGGYVPTVMRVRMIAGLMLVLGSVGLATQDLLGGAEAAVEAPPVPISYPAASVEMERLAIVEQRWRRAEAISARHTTIQAPLVFPARPGMVAGERLWSYPPSQLSEREVGVLIDAAADLLGIDPRVVRRVRPGLIRLAEAESNRRPALVQQVEDANSAYPHRARGLYQLTPWLFRAAHVPPYDNIYAPLDNTLAALQIFSTTPSQRGLLVTHRGDQIDSCGRLMRDPQRPPCATPGVWPRSGGWTTRSYRPAHNPYLDARRLRLAERHWPF